MIYKKICINIIFTASTSATIVITTHYIEEARQAHRVGLGSSRVGRLTGWVWEGLVSEAQRVDLSRPRLGRFTG